MPDGRRQALFHTTQGVSYQTNTEKSSIFCDFAKFLGLSDVNILHNFFVDKMLGDKTELLSRMK